MLFPDARYWCKSPRRQLGPQVAGHMIQMAKSWGGIISGSKRSAMVRKSTHHNILVQNTTRGECQYISR